MAATASPQSSPPRKEQRIIERPRLIKLLDETDARTILLLAPAGYGKTTLARQWARTLSGAVWVSLSSEDRDVAVIARKVARAVDGPAGVALPFVASYLKAHGNPQRMAREVALVVAEQVRTARIQWVVVDDYNEIIAQPEAETFMAVLNAEVSGRFLIASRLRPTWATARLAMYGDVFELDRASLAMSVEESKRVLGRHPELDDLLVQADGWPAVIGLAASARSVRLPDAMLNSGLLHGYFTEELFKAASESLQRALMRLALAPDAANETLAGLFGEDAKSLICDATELGFMTCGAANRELHPLVRDFLLRKVAAAPEANELVDDAIDACLERGRWERAFDLILRFEREDRVEPTLEAAYMPLIRSGETGTLARFAARIRLAPSYPPAVIDLAEADIALADGAVDLASRLAHRATTRLCPGHALASRARIVIGESAYARAELEEAEEAYQAAYESACNEPDAIAALRGWALASLQGEVAAPDWVMTTLESRRANSALDLLRHSILELRRLHFTTGYANARPLIDEAESVMQQVDDPRARSSFTHVAAYVTGLAARYADATHFQQLCDLDIEAFDLDFARPHSFWNHAYLALGQRKFGTVERMLQMLEDRLEQHSLDYHVLNGRILRARLALQTGKPDLAVESLRPIEREVVIPSIHGEYLATSALALVVRGDGEAGLAAANAAEEITQAVEVRVLVPVVRALVSEGAQRTEGALVAWEAAEQLAAWDPLVAAIRSSQELADTYAGVDRIRPSLAALYQRSNDLGLTRRAGLRVRTSRDPGELLSPRELEVLGLLTRGFRNQDIADALVVSPSTVKVHVRHIFEKLGVRTRAEAAARLRMFETR